MFAALSGCYKSVSLDDFEDSFLSRDCFITNSVGAFILVLVSLW